MNPYVATSYTDCGSPIRTTVFNIDHPNPQNDIGYESLRTDFTMPPKKMKPKPKAVSKEVKPKDRKSVQGDAVICDLSENDQNLFLAISFGKIHRLESALQGTYSVKEIRNHEMQTLLIYATHTTTGELCNQLVRTLLTHGCDVNAQDVYGRTALMYACADTDSDDSVRHLIRRPTCDPNLVDCEGNSALMFAVAADSISAVALLLKHSKVRHKVNLNIVNCVGLTALDMAVALKSVECCKLIAETSGHKITKVADEEGLSALIGVGKINTESSV